MTRARKLRAAVISAAFLVPFAVAAMPLQATRHSWFWPFSSYPMYSAAHFPGDTVYLRELRARSCAAPGAPARPVGREDIPVRIFLLWNMLEKVAKDLPGAEKVPATLVPIVDKHVPNTCAVEVWEQSWPITERGLESRTPLERRIADWPVRR